MPASKLVTLIQRTERAIDQSTQHPAKRASLRKELVWSLATWSVSDALGNLHGIKTSINRSTEESYSLAAFLHATTLLGIKDSAAMTMCRARATDVARFRQLADELGMDPREILRREPNDNILGALRADLESLSVYLDPRAVEEILLSALETRAVKAKGRGRKYTEVFGLCFGSHKRERDLKSRAYETLLHVSRVAPQFRAEAAAGWVQPNGESARIQQEVARAVFPHLELLGDFHSHPYDSVADLKASCGWEYSNADQESARDWIEEMREAGRPLPRFSLIAAVAEVKRRGGHTVKRQARHRFRFAVDRYLVDLACYRLTLTGNYDREVELLCPGIWAV